jgi:hypothetical protein
MRQFRTRGIEKVGNEHTLSNLAYNLTRMYSVERSEEHSPKDKNTVPLTPERPITLIRLELLAALSCNLVATLPQSQYPRHTHRVLTQTL